MGADTPQNIMLKSWCVIWTLFPVQCGQSCFLRKDTDGWSVLIKASVAPYWHNRFHWELCKFKQSAQPRLTLSLLLTLNICTTYVNSCWDDSYLTCYFKAYAFPLDVAGYLGLISAQRKTFQKKLKTKLLFIKETQQQPYISQATTVHCVIFFSLVIVLTCFCGLSVLHCSFFPFSHFMQFYLLHLFILYNLSSHQIFPHLKCTSPIFFPAALTAVATWGQHWLV